MLRPRLFQRSHHARFSASVHIKCPVRYGGPQRAAHIGSDGGEEGSKVGWVYAARRLPLPPIGTDASHTPAIASATNTQPSLPHCSSSPKRRLDSTGYIVDNSERGNIFAVEPRQLYTSSPTSSRAASQGLGGLQGLLLLAAVCGVVAVATLGVASNPEDTLQVGWPAGAAGLEPPQGLVQTARHVLMCHVRPMLDALPSGPWIHACAGGGCQRWRPRQPELYCWAAVGGSVRPHGASAAPRFACAQVLEKSDQSLKLQF